MKRIGCLLVILFCAATFAFAQGGSGRVTKKKKPVVKKIDQQIAEAEKAWTPFWTNFRETIKTKDSKGFYETMPESFVYGFGIYKRRNVGTAQNIKEVFQNETEDSITDDWWQMLERLSAKGVTDLLRKGNEIACHGEAKTLSKVSPNNWNNIANGESENNRYMLFEFRSNRWFFVALNFCETE